MQKLRKAMPELEADAATSIRPKSLLKRLRDGEIDLGFLRCRSIRRGPGIARAVPGGFTVALPNDHPLAQKPTVKVQDLKDQTLLLLEDGHCLRDQALEVCSRVDVREAEDFRAT